MPALLVLGGAYQFGCRTFELVAHHVVLLTGHLPERCRTSIGELADHAFLVLIALLLGGKLVAHFEYAIEPCKIRDSRMQWSWLLLLRRNRIGLCQIAYFL